MGGKPDETFAVGSAVMVEQPPFVTGVFGIGVNVGAGEAVGVGIGDDSAQEVRRRKDKSRKKKAKSFFVGTRSPFHMSLRVAPWCHETISATGRLLLEDSQSHCLYCPTAFLNSSNE